MPRNSSAFRVLNSNSPRIRVVPEWSTLPRCDRRRLRRISHRRLHREAYLNTCDLKVRFLRDNERRGCRLHGETTKAAKYANTELPATVPFVLESTGFLGKCADALLEKVTRGSPHLIKWFKGEMSPILARCEGRMRLHSQSLLVV